MAGKWVIEDDAPKGQWVIEDAPAAVKVGRGLNEIPRQAGLLARYGMEGLANTAQIFTEPVAGLMRVAGVPTKPLGAIASRIADGIGLPMPEGANERVVGDATRLLAGGGGLGAAAKAATQLPGLIGKSGAFLSANMPAQLTSAAGAGLAGGASREAGGSEMAQIGASLLGGVGAGMVPGIGKSIGTSLGGLVNKLSPQQLDAQITAVLNRAGVDYSQIPAAAQKSLRAEMAAALNTGREFDPQAVARLADFKTVGATPTRGAISQNPVQITREMNLAKIGANTSDEGLQGLAGVQNRNNTVLINNLNSLGANRGGLQSAGESVNATVLGRQAGLRSAEQTAWGAAKASPGYTQPIEAHVFSQINRALGDEGLMPFMNPTISNYIEAFQKGQPFTPQAYKNLQSMLSNELSKGGNEAAAARAARNVLNNSQMRPITNPGAIDLGTAPVTSQTGQSLQAVDQARAATKAAYAYEDSSPLVRSVLSQGSNSDPMRIAQRYVVGGTPNEAAMLAQEVGEAGRGPIRDALIAHLKNKSLNGAADEVGKFSQSAFNKALRDIGDRKLSLFFSPEEILNLRAVGRVSSYMQVQPVGSAVNNSNSGALAVGKGYDAMKGLLGKMPFGQSLVLDPLRNIEISMRGNQAQNVLPGLLRPTQRPSLLQPLTLPMIATGGLLAAP